MRSFLALLALALCAHAAHAKEVMPNSPARLSDRSTGAHSLAGGAHPLNAQAADTLITFTMPRYHANANGVGVPRVSKYRFVYRMDRA